MSKDKLILMGVISAAHGIKGDVVIKSFTSPSKNIVERTVQDESGRIIELNYLHNKKDSEIVCHIAGIDTRNQAESLKKTALYCKRSVLPEQADNEFYFEDLKGLLVKNEAGENIGKITNILNFGAGDIIEIQFLDNEQAELFPFNKDCFPVIDKDFVMLKR